VRFLGTDMNPKILCKWLEISDWPPDHYALLGLKAGEGDTARIEHHVQERMAKLRCYQLSHPEEATEGMNRVAQAFICLTDRVTKQPKIEMRSSGGVGSLPPLAGSTNPAAMETQQLEPTGTNTEVDWKHTPPPVRSLKELNGPPDSERRSVSPPVTDGAKAPGVSAPLAAAPAAPAVPVPYPMDVVFELAHASAEARRGLGTLPALIERINLTRKLILSWNQAGKYLSNPDKKLTRPAEETDLTRRLNKLFELSADFPKIVGHPGQPGYRVVAMARLEMTAEMFKMLDETQRAWLARDWEAGYHVLLSHRQFLRLQFKILRNRGPASLVLQAVRSALNDHPVWVLTGVLLVAGLCALLYWKVF
jgi:hypothetical protein